MAEDANSSRVQILIAADILLICLPTVALSLRFISRKLVPKGLWYDDYVMLAALPMALMVPILNLISMRFGFGWHESALNRDMARRSMQLLYIVQLFYATAITTVKALLLFTYARIFTGRGFCRCLYSVGTLIALVWCAFVFVTIFQCRPIQFFWDRESGGSCLRPSSLFVGMSIPNIMLDFVVLAMPLASIWQLQLPRLQKAGLTVVFGVGVIATATSIYRVVLILQITDTDITYHWVDLGVWSAIEPNLGITMASLAMCRPLTLRVITGLKSRIQRSCSTQASAYKKEVLQKIPEMNIRNDSDNREIPFVQRSPLGLEWSGAQELRERIESFGTTSRVDTISLRVSHDTEDSRPMTSDSIHITREFSVTGKSRW